VSHLEVKKSTRSVLNINDMTLQNSSIQRLVGLFFGLQQMWVLSSKIKRSKLVAHCYVLLGPTSQCAGKNIYTPQQVAFDFIWLICGNRRINAKPPFSRRTHRERTNRILSRLEMEAPSRRISWQTLSVSVASRFLKSVGFNSCWILNGKRQ
jgi:hypothetical protein